MQVCKKFYWAMQDANYNVLGIASRTGRLIERYEYTPYGERTVYSHGWLPADFNDDGIVDVTDLGIYSSNSGGSGTIDQGDASGDGFVDVTDMGLVSTYWQISVVPDNALVTYATMESFWQVEKCFEPFDFRIAEEFDLCPAVRSANYGTDGDGEDIF
jgi:hypothetical protein